MRAKLIKQLMHVQQACTSVMYGDMLLLVVTFYGRQPSSLTWREVLLSSFSCFSSYFCSSHCYVRTLQIQWLLSLAVVFGDTSYATAADASTVLGYDSDDDYHGDSW